MIDTDDHHRCYYDNEDCSSGPLWQCKTCSEWFCYYHSHTTSKGVDVECVACEYLRTEEEVDDNIAEMISRWEKEDNNDT